MRESHGTSIYIYIATCMNVVLSRPEDENLAETRGGWGRKAVYIVHVPPYAMIPGRYSKIPSSCEELPPLNTTNPGLLGCMITHTSKHGRIIAKIPIIEYSI